MNRSPVNSTLDLQIKLILLIVAVTFVGWSFWKLFKWLFG